ncbi:hypothetical protein Tco_1463804, partial [Tanacetum coccineum]
VLFKNRNVISDLKTKVHLLEIKAENGGSIHEEIEDRISFMKQIEEMEHINNLNMIQKANVKWVIEGDRNLKYFHGLFNNKFAKSRISGMDINEAWVSDPYLVISHISLLDASFSIKEIKDVVWGYGSEKALGIDGFTFKFIKHF